MRKPKEITITEKEFSLIVEYLLKEQEWYETLKIEDPKYYKEVKMEHMLCLGLIEKIEKVKTVWNKVSKGIYQAEHDPSLYKMVVK